MHPGDRLQLSATVLPLFAEDLSVVWESGAPAVASVDETGQVTAIGVGSTLITVTSNAGGKEAYCLVEVLDAGESLPESGPVLCYAGTKSNEKGVYVFPAERGSLALTLAQDIIDSVALAGGEYSVYCDLDNDGVRDAIPLSLGQSNQAACSLQLQYDNLSYWLTAARDGESTLLLSFTEEQQSAYGLPAETAIDCTFSYDLNHVTYDQTVAYRLLLRDGEAAEDAFFRSCQANEEIEASIIWQAWDGDHGVYEDISGVSDVSVEVSNCGAKQDC